MVRGFNLLAGGVLLLYPLLVYVGMTRWSHDALALMLLPLFALRLLPGSAALREWLWAARLAGVVGLALVVLSLWFKAQHWLLFYPLVVNLTLLAVFGWSLRQPMTLVERLARLTTPDLPPRGVRYTRRVTQVWCLFFIINAALATLTILHGDLALWSLYNGLISYVLIGVLMGGEWLVRRHVMRGGDNDPT
ncbi:Uncharacterized membrane protein [Aeromonas sp. RU39B]|uniref:COG4648 family protein n=1 Tax=Aeromonas sp. RU39B TaxID=1907416 RepID=UPI0009566830|nr:hypothetical protein [Aeromonas sp. RU39B]SIQ36995.1 Uncharacterized membrane protein [Aeromonas sp. RU39B]